MFIFVLGLEGCGHHGLSKVVNHSMKNASKSIDFEVSKLRCVRESIVFGAPKELFQNQIEALSHLYGQFDCLYEDTSYPHGGRRSVARQYTFSDEYPYFAKIGSIKVLHLKRNTYNTINSHPHWDGGIINHTKVLSQIQTESIEKELSVLRSAQALSQVGEIAKGAKVVNGTTVITALLGDGISGDDLRKIALELRSKAANSVVALISVNDSKPVLVVAASDAARAGGVKAGALVKIGSTVLGGGGGGKDDFAQGGGTDAAKSVDALAAISHALVG